MKDWENPLVCISAIVRSSLPCSNSPCCFRRTCNSHSTAAKFSPDWTQRCKSSCFSWGWPDWLDRGIGRSGFDVLKTGSFGKKQFPHHPTPIYEHVNSSSPCDFLPTASSCWGTQLLPATPSVLQDGHAQPDAYCCWWWPAQEDHQLCQQVPFQVGWLQGLHQQGQVQAHVLQVQAQV